MYQTLNYFLTANIALLSLTTVFCPRLSIRNYVEQFSRRVDPRGNTYFWLAGEAVKDLDAVGVGPSEWPSDFAQIESKAPSLSPIQPDLFWRGSLLDLPDLNSSGQFVR